MNLALELADLGLDPTLGDEALLELLVQQQACAIEWLDQVKRQWPVATSVLWDAAQAACDQRRAVAGAMLAPTIGIIVGGNRSGKTAGMLDLLVANALGGDHPAVVAWCKVNGLPNTIPHGPGEVFLVAQSSSDSMRYHRPDIDERVGEGKVWNNRNGKGEASLEIRVPGYDHPAKIWFKSLDQKRKSFQGVSLRFVGIDEEPLGDEGEGILDECLLRVADQKGQVVISMTPLEGLTWLYERYFARRGRNDASNREEDDGVRIFELDTLDNPHLPREFFERLFAGMDEQQRQQRRFGRYQSRAGVVYSQWAIGDGLREGPGHVVDDFDIPADWPRFRGADFGLVNPTCVLWGAIGDDGTLYIYREYYVPNGESYAWHADRVADLEGWGRGREGERVRTETTEAVECGWGDPAAREAREEFAAKNVGVVPANNDIKGGIDRLKERLRLQGDNRPRLKVMRRCVHTIREMGGLVWDPNRKDEVPLKKDDHAPDALRYLNMGLAEYYAMFG